MQYRYGFNNLQHSELIEKYGLQELNSPINKYFYFLKSVERENIPVNKKFIRAHTYIVGITIEEVENNPGQIR